jgi:hypothetical protein
MKDMKPTVSFDKLMTLMVDAYKQESNGRFDQLTIAFHHYVDDKLTLVFIENKHLNIENKHLNFDEVIWPSTSINRFCICKNDVNAKQEYDWFLKMCQDKIYVKTTDKRVPNEVKDIIVRRILTMFESGAWLEASSCSNVIPFFGKNKTIEQYLIEYDLNHEMA